MYVRRLRTIRIHVATRVSSIALQNEKTTSSFKFWMHVTINILSYVKKAKNKTGFLRLLDEENTFNKK